ncbi:RPAP1-like protein [Truncatella angustata]|uniref:RPAP1-like protein n=1 Tax=Truncatella angustata TaxID=152316 RepID=A0A9P8RJK2_9PEZI|nr:RPAP1-like protein [Truncatella angustata]KAH6638657.1 RPAP1-like protein [Truncatella angustata]
MDSPLLVSDVKEKKANSPQAPTFPQISSSSSGFPQHKKRTRISAFKQQQQQQQREPTSNHEAAQRGPPSGTQPRAPTLSEKQKIDRENKEKIASMSSTEIEEAQSELFGGLDPKTLEMLLRRANLDEKNGPSPFDQDTETSPPAAQAQDTSDPAPETSQPPKSSSAPRKVHFEDVPDEDDPVPIPAPAPTAREFSTQAEPHADAGDAEPPSVPSDHVHTEECASSGTHTHWPHAPSAPELDPADPNFLASLHDKYFPHLPADPSKLAWMAPIPTANSPADLDSPYHPTQSSIPVSQLRFDFRGALLPPRIARAVPTTRGLHHHGEAPEAAGYTIKELARLARSAVAGQRCIAYQTLGRILYRLGHGNYGSRGDALADGVWNSVVEGNVMQSLYEEAGVDPDAPPAGRGHRSAHAFAVEAIWLFEKGGWAETIRKDK